MKSLIIFLAGLASGYILNPLLRQRSGDSIENARVGFAYFPDDLTSVIGDIRKMELPEGKRVKLGVNLQTVRHHAGAVQEGSEIWISSDESVASVTADPENPKQAVVRGLDGSANQSVTIEYRADADRGEGVKEIVVATTVVVTQGDAVVGTVEMVGQPEDDTDEQPTPIETASPENTGGGNPVEGSATLGGDATSGTNAADTTGGAAANPANVDPVDRIKGDGTPGSGSADTPPASGAPDGSTTSPTAEAEATGDASKPIDTGTAPPADAGTTTEGMTFPEAAAKAKASTEGDGTPATADPSSSAVDKTNTTDQDS